MSTAFAQFHAQLSRVTQRWDALVARLPDFSRTTLPRQASVGLALSLLIHLVLFILLILAALIFPERVETQPLGREDKPLEIELVPMPSRENKLVTLEPKKTPILDSKGLEAAERPPESAQYESDRDMTAGSELPATGLMNLPSQDGRDDLPGQTFATQNVILGLIKPDEPDPPEPEPTAPASAPQAPGLRPLYDPLPVPKEALDKAQSAPPTQAIPPPSATPAPAKATPPPLKLLDTPRPDSLGVARLSPLATPSPREEPNRAKTSTPPPQQMAKLSTPAPLTKTPFKERYRESLTKTRIEGNISKRGKPGADAVKGPLGKYYRDMSLQVGSLWNHYTAGAPDMLNLGTVKVRFNIHADGRVTNAAVVNDGGDRRHAEVCLRAVQSAKLNPLPPDVVPTLADGTLEVVYSFTLF